MERACRDRVAGPCAGSAVGVPECLVLVNVGNTHAQVALWRAGKLLPPRKFLTREFEGNWRDAWHAWAGERALPVLVATVVPRVREFLRQQVDVPLARFLDTGMVMGLDFSNVDSGTLGADRVANAVAAVRLFGTPVVVLDCGTAITTEAVDRGSRFLGGAILPGRALLRRALHDHTGQLPLVELQDELPPAVGPATKPAILAGVDRGVVCAVQGLLAETRRQMGQPDCRVVAVGGDAPFFLRHVPGLTAGPDDFTLRGLAAVATDAPGRVWGLAKQATSP